jgi:hypothetical protein
MEIAATALKPHPVTIRTRQRASPALGGESYKT